MERVERQVIAAISAGAEVSLQDALDGFDRDLMAEPVRNEYTELREALGV